MRVEEIALRQEVRQMLAEAGFTKNTLKDMVKEVLMEELDKAVKQAFNEKDVQGYIQRNLDSVFKSTIKQSVSKEIQNRVTLMLNHMRLNVSVDISDNNGNYIVSSPDLPND